jgi:hypothetical protein
METNKSGIHEVVGRVIRNTRVQDTSYFADLFTWITEAAADMRTKWTLQQTWMDKQVYFYKCELPCGLVVLTAVEFDGRRVPQRNVSRHPALVPSQYDGDSGVFISVVEQGTSPNGFPTYTQSSEAIPVVTDDTAWYQEDGPGYIAMSFKEGLVRLHYKQTPLDQKGFPIIPDQENYKEALYWYCRMKMIESGWTDPVLNWEICNANYSYNAERGRAAIKFPSTNRLEEMCDMITLIPPQNYFDTFGNFQSNIYNEGTQPKY